MGILLWKYLTFKGKYALQTKHVSSAAVNTFKIFKNKTLKNKIGSLKNYIWSELKANLLICASFQVGCFFDTFFYFFLVIWLYWYMI